MIQKEPVDKMKMAELKSQGNKAAGRKKFLSAAEFYSMALDLDPEDATLFSNRSLCWLHMASLCSVYWMLLNVEKSDLIGQRLAIGKA